MGFFLAALPVNFWSKEKAWLEAVESATIPMEDNEPVGNVSYAAYHAARQRSEGKTRVPALNALLPLFHQKSTDPDMVKHGMDIVALNTEYLNEGQIPVMYADQVIFTIAKLIQWNCPDKYAENKFVVMLGPLHIEKSFLVMIGQLLEGSGWKSVVSNSGVITDGSAEAILKVNYKL